MSNCVTTPTEDAPWGPLSVYRDSIIHVKRRSSNCSTSPQLFSPFCPPRVVGDGVCRGKSRNKAVWSERISRSANSTCRTAKLLQLLQHPFSHFSLKMVFNLLRLDSRHAPCFPSTKYRNGPSLLFSYTLDEFSLLSRCKSIAGRCLLVLLECGYFVESLSKQFRTKPFGPNKSI